MIIGITGTLGAGKGTVVEILKKRGFSHYSSSDILKDILKERNTLATRENLSNLANELMKEYEGGILHFSHQRAKKEGANKYILESLHRVSEAEYVKKIGGVVLGIDADIKIRYDRISIRKHGEKDNVTFEQFVADSKREDEGQTGSGPNIKAVIQMADYTIYNDGDITALSGEVEKFLKDFAI